MQGYLFANGDTIPNSTEAIRLYVHEASRVYCDKLVNFEDKSGFEILIHETLKKNINVTIISSRNLITVSNFIFH